MLAALAALVACRPDDPWTPTPPGTGPEGPALLVSRPDPALPLARELAWPEAPPGEATVTWSDGVHEATVTALLGGEHLVPLLRMGPDRDVEVTVVRGDLEARATFHTAPLPPFADVTLLALDEDATMPGDTLVGVVSPGVGSYQVVLDPHGEVVWLWSRSPRILELQLGADGLLLGNEDNGGLFEMDWLGRYRRHWMPADRAIDGDIAVDVARFHHDAQRLPDGTIVGMVSDTVRPATFPVSYEDPAARTEAARVRVDAAVLIDPDSGGIVSRLVTSDAIPLERIGYESLNGDPDDWVHANGVAYSPENDAFVVSSRHQDALMGFDRDGAVRWILANPDNWPPEAEALRLQPVGPAFDWSFKQHAPEWWAGDRILCFDNGNYRASPWTGTPKLGPEETWSRIVEFEIDEVERTVRLAWEFEIPGTRLFASYMGDADHLPNGHVLGNFAGVVRMDGVALRELGLGAHLIRLVEFAPETGELLWDVQLSSDGDAVADGWNSYRAQRLPVGWETDR